MNLPRLLILTGFFVTVFALLKIIQATNGLPERPHWSQLGNRAKMDADACEGWDGRYIPVYGRVGGGE